MSGLFAKQPGRTIWTPTHDDLRWMGHDLQGFHRRHGESWDLLQRLAVTDPARWPKGIDGVIQEKIDGERFWLFWNGTEETLMRTHMPVETWPRHAWTFGSGLPLGYWSDTAGWQWSEGDWLAAFHAHVVRRESRPRERV